MNLKEAFRYQNKIQRLMDDAHSILSRDRNITKVENTHLRHKVMAEAEDETTVDTPDTEYADQITSVVILLMYLLDLREKLSAAIRVAKKDLTIDFDGESASTASDRTMPSSSSTWVRFAAPRWSCPVWAAVTASMPRAIR